MADPVLATKLYVPPLRPNLVPRPHLIERLNEGLRLGRRLTLVSASAGFGKTTLIVEWLHCVDRAFAWLSLDRDDNDPRRFFTYLVAALQRIDEHLGQAVQSLLAAPQLPPAEALVTTLINDVATVPQPFLLVLDDVHLIHASAIHDALAFLLDRQPPQIHVVLATRQDPPLSLPRLRVRDHVTEIGADDLRFSVEEATAFLNQTLGLALSTKVVAALEARTEGWIAGLQLASLALQPTVARRPTLAMQDKMEGEIRNFVAAFSGSHRHVIDYLADEVLAQQPAAIQEFLAQTGILERLTASLCDELTGRKDSDEVLRQLEEANLFLIPLDDRREWYRYHRLFADFLRTELDSRAQATLHLSAAHWFEAHDLHSEAIHHALSYGDLTGSTAEAVRLIRQAGGWALASGMLVTLLGWLDRLPEEIVRGSAELASYKAWALFVTGKTEEGAFYIQQAEASLPEDASSLDRGRLLSLRCNLASSREVLDLAREALELIGDDDPFTSGITLFMLGDAQDKVGNVAGAIESFRRVLRLNQQIGQQLPTAVAVAHLALSLHGQGKRHEAIAVCREAADHYRDARDHPLPIAGLIYAVLGELAHEGNELTQARQYLQTGLELGRLSATTAVILYALEGLVQLQYAMGETGTALATIREARHLAYHHARGLWYDAVLAVEADLQLRAGNHAFVEHWAENANLPIAGSPDPVRKFEYRTLARFLLSQHRLEELQALLANLECSARRDDRRRDLITIHILQALGRWRQGQGTEALTCLKPALQLAAPEGYVRAFLDEGREVADLLPGVRQVAPGFVDGLLTAFGVAKSEPTEQALPATQPAPLVERLTERELDVLRLMAADLLAPDIARELVIAVSTVRSHIKSIYRKLDVHSRYEAVERARALNLL